MKRAWVPVLALIVAFIFSFSHLSGATAQSEEHNATDLYSSGSLPYERKPMKGEAEYNQLFVKHTEEINSMILGPILPAKITAQLPHFIVTWLRNWAAALILYFVSGGGYYVWTYWWKRDQYFPKGQTLKKKYILEQIAMGLIAIPALVALPTFAEFIVEKGWTLCYVDIEEVGWVNWTMHIGAYLIFVEFWVYWAHRWLHSPLLYKYLHHSHHFYYNPKTVSPFAGLAFNPIDGILQASPLVFALLVVPMHFRTYYILFFLEEIWSANIHDTIEGGYFGILGAGYHNYHHTHYNYNYGHLTTFMDWICGTLIDPKTGPNAGQNKLAREPTREKALKSS